jgi:alanine-glyoxylate transaminase / serine-glyoxylate transaminase / serine-pyruvate transaminase
MTKLMIPGPVQPSTKVLNSVQNSVVAHFGSDWVNYYNQTTSLIKKLFKTSGIVHLIAGSGSSGVDASFGSCLASGEKIIIGVNGYFGERLREIALNYGLRVISVEAPWNKPINPLQINTAIIENPDVKLIAVVHLETSTTIINPIQAIGEIVRQHDKLFFVDAVSSLGGMPFLMDTWKIDICVSASQKCLGSLAGLALIAIGERGLRGINHSNQRNHGWYLDLKTWGDYAEAWKDWHPYPVTMPTSLIVALRTSLEELFEEGETNRFDRYQQVGLHLRKKLQEIKLQPYTKDEEMSPVITAVLNRRSSTIAKKLEQDFDIKVATGLGLLAGKIFRIGHMAPLINISDIDELIIALREILKNSKIE